MKYDYLLSLLFLLPASLHAQGTMESLDNIYQVKKGDTAYSIATSHGISLEDLYRSNPDIIGGKIKKGAFLVIPQKTNAAPQQQAVQIQPAAPQQTIQPTDARPYYESLRVAVLLPFEEKSARAPKFLEFYQGFLMAVDSISSRGTNVSVYALNTGSTAAHIKQVLEEPELQSMQLIIGPADQSQVPALSDFCQQHGIKLVLPFANLKSASGEHSTVYNATPQGSVIQQRVSSFFAEKQAEKNYIVLNTDEADEKGKGLIDLLRTKLGEKGVSMRQMHILGDDQAYTSALNQFRENCIVPDNVSIKTLNIFFSRLKTFAEEHPEYKISLIGYPEWQTYTQSLLNEFYQFDTYIYSSYYRNPLLERTTEFERRFINHFGYGMAPTFPRYGMLGFDLGFYFMHGMATLGDNFDQQQNSLRLQPFQHPFVFAKDPDTKGFINESALIIHYSPEHTIDVIQ